MIPILGVHHVAIIVSNYAVSKRFYTEMLGAEVLAETYRADRCSHKLDLRLPDGLQIELFDFPQPPPRSSYPEACGLRHLAFAVADVAAVLTVLEQHGIAHEGIRIDGTTGKRFTFFRDPDGLPLECYER